MSDMGQSKVTPPAVQSKSGHKAPAGPGGVGNETKADMKGAFKGDPAEPNTLRGAIKHLGASDAPSSRGSEPKPVHAMKR